MDSYSRSTSPLRDISISLKELHHQAILVALFQM
jgi:hypothetical protein